MKLTELNELIAEFTDSKGLKPNSKRAYLTDLRFFAEFYAAEQIEVKDFSRQKFLTWLKQYPPRAANRRGTNIRKFLLWLSTKKEIDIHPEIHLPWQFHDPTPQKPDRAIDLTEEEFNSLISSPTLSLTKRCILALLMTVGASLEELAVLKWKNISFGKSAHLTVGEYGKERVVPLEHSVEKLLAQLQEKTFTDDKLTQTDDDAENEMIFRQERGEEAISAAYMAMIVRRSAIKVLDREISPTEFYEYAKKRILGNYSLEVALEMLGKKRASSVVRMDEQKVDLERLRGIHALAFG